MRRWEIEIISSCLFLVALFFLASCGGSKEERYYEEGFQGNPSDKTLSQATPNEAKFDFWLSDAKSSAQHTFPSQSMTECQLAKDPNSNQLFFSVGFSDTASATSMKLKVITKHTDMQQGPINDTQTILGAGKNSGTINIVAGEKLGNYWNSLVAPNQSEPIQSQCNVSYSISNAGIQGELVCNSLVNGGNQRASGIINFSCAVAQNQHPNTQPKQ